MFEVQKGGMRSFFEQDHQEGYLGSHKASGVEGSKWAGCLWCKPIGLRLRLELERTLGGEWLLSKLLEK